MDPAVTAPSFAPTLRCVATVRFARVGVLSLVLLGQAAAWALPDPMRPTPGAGATQSVRPAGSAPTAGVQASGAIPGAAPGAATGAAPGEVSASTPSSAVAGAPAAPSPADGLRLSSIRHPAAGAAQALIGDQWVRAGDRIAGWRVLAVDAEEVRLERGSERLALRLWPKSLSPQPETATAAAAPAAAPERRTRSSR